MGWKKLGHVFSHDGSYAAVPIAEYRGSGRYRIYYSARDDRNRSITHWVEIDLADPSAILARSAQPVLVPGALGEFDDSGAMASWLVPHAGQEYLYYIGWNLGVSVPFRNAIGLAVGRDGHFTRFRDGPLLERTMDEPHFTASCCVMPGTPWRMWYLSCTRWSMHDGAPRHHYHIKYAESDDGIHWRRDGTVAIDFKDESEYAISRPSVLRDAQGWHMWYSYRGAHYRIGYAHSADGIHWQRHDDRAGIDVSTEGWDSEMIEYPFVFEHENQRFMLYNGNGYGKTGFGLARWEHA